MISANTNRPVHAVSGVKAFVRVVGIDSPVGLSSCMQGVEGPADPQGASVSPS
jgi:hypothetical protein